MREAWVIAKREFLERVRSKWFVVMTILWPVLMVGMIVVPALLVGRGYEGAKVQIVDHTRALGPTLVAKLAEPPTQWKAELVPEATTEPELLGRIHDKTINGFIVVPAGILDGGIVDYKGDNASNQAVGMLLQRAVNRAVLAERARASNLTPDQRDRLLKDVVVIPTHTTGEAGGMSGVTSFLVGYMIAFILYIAITLYGINVMRSVITDKSSRVVELLVAATKPRALMAGKIAGVGAAGLAQIAIWLGIGAIALAYKATLLEAFGASADAGMKLPSLSPEQIAVVLAFFVTGFLFYSAMYAAVGAMVSSEQDSQQAQMPITMFLVIGMVCMSMVTNDPRGGTTAVMTLVPFWSPMLMPLRYFLGGATLAQVGLSLGLLIVATYVVSRGAAKIYRVGILMYGKRPSVGEIVRWLRY